MKVAVIHDWLVTKAGAESVLQQILILYPQADVYCVVNFLNDADARSIIGTANLTTSFIQNLPFARKLYRNYLPIMPLAVEQFNLSAYDLIISSSHAVAKGVLTSPNQIHICYCHSPMRYAWDLQHQYLQESGLTRGFKGLLAQWILHKMRMWDVRTANGVDYFIANSHYIQRRIAKTYRRESAVIYPPVDTQAFTPCHTKEDYYLTASRMVPYKKIPLIVEAFAAMPDKKLIVIGDGPDFLKIKSIAPPNVTLMGYQPLHILRDHMQKAKAFIFAAEEDFGIAPIEAQACGTPVIAYSKGGVGETVRGLNSPQPTGVFFHEQSITAITAAVEIFEKNSNTITPAACRANAERFSIANFRHAFIEFSQDILSSQIRKVG